LNFTITPQLGTDYIYTKAYYTKVLSGYPSLCKALLHAGYSNGDYFIAPWEKRRFEKKKAAKAEAKAPNVSE
jgi:hypothetical protein